MKIALVAPHVPAPGSQATTDPGYQVTRLGEELARLGHQVTVYARKDAPSLPGRTKVAAGLTLEHVPAGPPARMTADELAPHIGAFGDHLARRWHKNPPDVAHAHFWTSGLAAMAGARGLGVPVFQTFMSLGAARPRRGARKPVPIARIRLEVSLARSVSAVLASSSQEMSDLASLGVPRASIRVVPCGVDTGEFGPDGPAAKRTGRPRLLTVAPLTEQQGIDIAIRAMTDLPEAELVVAGGPPRAKLAGDQHHQDLTQLARELKVADRVTFTGSVRSRDLPALMRSADLLVSTAWDEAPADVALAAMACGTPVVASALGCYQDLIVDGTTGLLVPPGQPALLARRIRRLLASPMQLEAFGLAATDRARARYSWDRIGRETVSAYARSLPEADAPLAEDEGALDEDEAMDITTAA